jgi:chromosome segregation ATPase
VSGPDLSFIPLAGNGAGPAAAVNIRPMSQADILFQGFESRLENARLSVRNLRQDLKVEAAAHAETKKVKEELKQAQDTRAERGLAREGALRGEHSLLMKQVSDLEDELKAKSDALSKAKKQVREAGQSLKTLQSLCEGMRRERDTYKDGHHDLGEEIQELTDELDKANNKARRLLDDRTKVNDALQVSRRKKKEHEAAAQSSITALNLEVKLLQAFKEKSQNEDDQLNEQLQNRCENEQALHRRDVDLQRRNDDLNSDIRKARSEHQRKLERQSRELVMHRNCNGSSILFRC